EIIFVVAEEFFETGAGDVGELDLAFFGRAGNLAAFSDVLIAAAGGLDHLVVGARAFVYEPVAEAHRGIVDDLRFPVGEEVLVTAVRRNEAGRGLRGRMRRIVGGDLLRRVGLIRPIL